MRFRANHLIDTFASPERAGSKFAEELLDQRLVWEGLQIQLTGIRASLHVSSFWHAFRKVLEENAPGLLPDIREVDWICDHEFQETNIREWLNDHSVIT